MVAFTLTEKAFTLTENAFLSLRMVPLTSLNGYFGNEVLFRPKVLEPSERLIATMFAGFDAWLALCHMIHPFFWLRIHFPDSSLVTHSLILTSIPSSDGFRVTSLGSILRMPKTFSAMSASKRETKRS